MMQIECKMKYGKIDWIDVAKAFRSMQQAFVWEL
jgi:hypothetical protein